MEESQAILFFDGHCNLCNSTVDFLIQRDPEIRLKFAPLQGETAKKCLDSELIQSQGTVVFWREGHTYLRSKAIFKVAHLLGGSLSLILPFQILPRFITDAGYRLVAKYRYRIFGKKDTCRVPTEKERKHFLP